MIKKLKRRFVLNTMLLLIAVFLFMTVGFHLYYNYETRQEDEALLYWVANTGSLSDEDIEKFYEGREASTYITKDETTYGNIIAIQYDAQGSFLALDSMKDLSPAEEADMRKTGDAILGGHPFVPKHISYRLVKKDYGSYLVMMDTTGSFLIFQYSDYLIAGGIFLAVLILLFLVSLLLSRFVTKPAEISLNRQKQFISDASHELKTPLAAIMLNAEVLRGTHGDDPCLTNILSEAARMEKLIKNLLELAKADDASHKLIMEEFNLSDALLQMVLPFESRAYEERIQLESHIEEDLSYYGNSDDIKQVIAILIDNAFKHTHEGGLICVDLTRNGTTRVIRVFNTGEGISAKDLPHIFERFYSCDNARSGSGKSYGLGLAIAQAIVTKHGGSLSAHSEYGKNAEFVVLLPQLHRKRRQKQSLDL